LSRLNGPLPAKAGSSAPTQRPASGEFRARGLGAPAPTPLALPPRFSPAVHAPRANRRFIKLAQSRPKVKFSNRKVKKRIENAQPRYRESAGAARQAKTRGAPIPFEPENPGSNPSARALREPIGRGNISVDARRRGLVRALLTTFLRASGTGAISLLVGYGSRAERRV
jgi:hypothetical protein